MKVYVVVTVLAAALLEDVFCKDTRLKQGDPGVCQENITIGCHRKSRKPCPKKMVYVCCDGYKYDNVGGKCVPEVIKCIRPCVNAKCTATDTCICDAGLEQLNSTHCGPLCPDDFYNDFSIPTLACTPKCTQPCINGNCTDIDTCICNAGYKLKNGSKYECEPECLGCENGVCVAPNSCVCNTGYTGYTEKDYGKCKPVCSHCEHGNCIAPNDCQCHKGYTKIGNVCVPDCERKCTHGQCTAPNVCECEANYKLDASDKFKCNPTCVNKCINATCVSPDTCACNKGFIPAGNSWTCRPKCDFCENGDCIAPNKCRCNKGYVKNDNDICLPVCSEECVNGYCSAPEKCQCNLGYIYDESMKYCSPVCKERCVNAKCTAINTCTCDAGLEQLNSTHCGPLCPDDFYNDLSIPTLACTPKCTQPCINGNCTDIDTCICNAGYKLKNGSKYECEPECLGCENGVCVAPNSCVCNTGYTGYTDKHYGKCKPVCSHCEHGNCIAPNDCQCHMGYTKIGNVCVPDCERKCTHGQCTAPNVCECEANYKLDASDKFKCNPTCVNKCINATCVSPDTCACNKGFIPAGNSWTCRPKCDFCENGDCIAPNKCRCNKGYVKNDNDICLPVCSDECVNGYCSAPEKCQCNLGYIYDESMKYCSPVCKERCINATCVGPNKCDCWSGYSLSNTTASCKPVCSSCRNGQCIAPDLCLCDEGYEKTNSTCVPVHMMNCKWCTFACNESACACANGTACDSTEQAGVASTPTLAGLQLTWMLGGAVGLLLLVFVVVLIHRTWRQSKTFERKAAGDNYNAYGSVVYTVPDTLMRQETTRHDEENEGDYDELESRQVQTELLRAASHDHVERM